jgi:cytochrome c553
MDLFDFWFFAFILRIILVELILNFSLPIKYVVLVMFLLLLIFSASFFMPQNKEGSTDVKKDDEIVQGQLAFESYCASCHGYSGEGNGPSAVTLSKLPPNFLNKEVIFKNGFSKAGLEKTINEGIPNSQMPKFDYLPEKVKKSLILYLQNIKS